jgi:SAM-dependent methyltransferase
MPATLRFLFCVDTLTREYAKKNAVSSEGCSAIGPRMTLYTSVRPRAGLERGAERVTPRAVAPPPSPPPPPSPGLPRRRLLGAAAPALLGCACCAGAVRAAPGRNAFMDDLFAQAMAGGGMAAYESKIEPLKRRLFAAAAAAPRGRDLEVVEVGMGAGPNLEFLDPERSRITAVDPNPFMRPYAERAAAERGWAPERLRWVAGVAEALPLADASADLVVCTLVLCSVADVPRALGEAARVLRPGGRLLFIEHTAARSAPFLRLKQAILDPLQQLLADGCHLCRDPLPAVEAAFGGAVEAERLVVPGQGLIGPHVAGIATRA